VVRYLIQLYTYGGNLFDKDGKKSFLNSDASVKALQDIADSINVYKFAPMSSLELDETKMRSLFVAGKIAIYNAGPYDIATIKEENPNLDFGTAVNPGQDGMGVSMSNGFSLMMPKNSKNKDAAAKFIEYVSRPENQIRLTNTFPARKSALANEKYQDKYLKPFAKQLENSILEPSHTKWPQIEKIIFSHMQLVVAQKETPKEAAEKMSIEADQILK
jgi:ABC-type glycerol-3-phosphate transport system substrate-binding protein